MSDDLVQVGQYLTSAEAAIVRGQLDAEGIRCELASESAAGWLWHVTPALSGVRLLVAAADAPRAEELIAKIHGISDAENASAAEHAEVAEFDPDANEYNDEEELPEELPAELIRAWRAALIGLFLCPPLLNLYSTWLLLRNGLFLDRCENWRIYAAGLLNVISIGIMLNFFLSMFR